MNNTAGNERQGTVDVTRGRHRENDDRAGTLQGQMQRPAEPHLPPAYVAVCAADRLRALLRVLSIGTVDAVVLSLAGARNDCLARGATVSGVSCSAVACLPFLQFRQSSFFSPLPVATILPALQGVQPISSASAAHLPYLQF